MLLFDGHGSHLTKQAFDFCYKHKIILLCRPSHSTHLLQALDVGVFGPVSDEYRAVLLKHTKLGANYSIDKLLFLQIVQKARVNAITPDNVKSAWAKVGLFHSTLKDVLVGWTSWFWLGKLQQIQQLLQLFDLIRLQKQHRNQSKHQATLLRLSSCLRKARRSWTLHLWT